MTTGIYHEPSTQYARIRTAQGTAEVYVGREFLDVNKARISYSYVAGAQGANTPTWRTVTSTVTAPSNAKFVRIWLVNYNNSNSTAWFDDIEFTPVNGNYSLISASDYAQHPALTDYPFGSVAREWTNTTPDIGKFKYQQKVEVIRNLVH